MGGGDVCRGGLFFFSCTKCIHSSYSLCCDVRRRLKSMVINANAYFMCEFLLLCIKFLNLGVLNEIMKWQSVRRSALFVNFERRLGCNSKNTVTYTSAVGSLCGFYMWRSSKQSRTIVNTCGGF